MALSPTGPISMSQIKAELSSASNSLRAYSLQAGFTIPDSMSEFFGYGAPTPPTPTPSYHVWNLYRSAGDTHPACSTTPAAQVIPYDSNYAIGVVFKGSNGFCYTIANDGFQVSPANITLSEEFGICTDCTETAPPPSPAAPAPAAPSVTLDWYAVAGPNGPCGTGAFSVTKNSTAMVNVLLSSSQNGTFSVIAGDVLVITMLAGASGQDCSDPYVEYSGNQFASDSQSGLGPVQAQITVTVSAGDILNGSIVIGGSLDGGLIPS